jgi:CheY-like chemotaxis protein
MSLTMTAPWVENEPPSSRPGLNVLIAEDNAEGAESLAYILEHAGHNVRVAYNGREAVAAAAIDPPDVLLTDVGLPGMNGWEVARSVRSILGERRCLILAITGYDLPADRLRSRNAGIDRHFAKPINPDVLLNLLSGMTPSAA